MKLIAKKYEVVHQLGKGGMGDVYLVRHADLGVSYALKLLNRELSEDARFIERFKLEAEVLLRFSHPGTTQLRDFGKTEDGLHYIAMDYCDGVPLKDILERDGPYPVKRALELIIEVLDVLEAAHQQGIVHRDIKPANLVVEEKNGITERLRVLDFGTALIKKHIGQKEADQGILGTPCYMSPEQAAGEIDLDHRSDIYSTGVLLYELLSGEVPFEGETVVQTLIMHLTQPPPSFASTYGIPEEVEEVMHRALAKKREERFQSCTEFSKACTEVITSLSRGSTGVTTKKTEKEKPKVTEAPQQSSAEQRGMKILCLDDNEMILHILEHILLKEGFQVFTAQDCSSIHDYLFQEKIDLLISDINMPGMPGTKICKLLKMEMEGLKVVLFSNIPDRELEKCSKENLADGWISKNTKPDTWLAEINRVVGRSTPKSQLTV